MKKESEREREIEIDMKRRIEQKLNENASQQFVFVYDMNVTQLEICCEDERESEKTERERDREWGRNSMNKTTSTNELQTKWLKAIKTHNSLKKKDGSSLNCLKIGKLSTQLMGKHMFASWLIFHNKIRKFYCTKKIWALSIGTRKRTHNSLANLLENL